MYFKKVILDDISKGKGSYGIGASAVDYNPSLYKYLRITDISDDGEINSNELMSVDDENACKYLLEENDIVFARTGNSTGKSYFYNKKDGVLVYAGFLIKFTLDDKKVNPKFMKYYTKSYEYKNWLKSISTGSTRKNINAKMYGSMEIQLPPRSQQDSMVNLLSKIDKKIEINKEINNNLEQQIQLLFEEWFMKFEFPNNLNKPYKSSGGKFKETNYGSIPLDWTDGILEDILILTKNNIKKENLKDLPYLPIDIIPMNSLSIKEFKNNDEAKSSLITFDKNDILIGAMRVYFHRVSIAPCAGITRNTCFVLKPYDDKYLGYALLLCNEDRTINYADITSKGSTMPYASWKNGLNKMPIVIPPLDIIEQFNEIIKPYLIKIRDSGFELEKLTKLRDTLLPKLMSGEIDVSEINFDLNPEESTIK